MVIFEPVGGLGSVEEEEVEMGRGGTEVEGERRKTIGWRERAEVVGESSGG